MRQECLECQANGKCSGGRPGSMGECVREELELTKSEAAALLCGLRWHVEYCNKCINHSASQAYLCDNLKLSGRDKLKAYIGR